MRRSELRFRVSLPALLLTLEGSWPVTIENLSRGGARLALPTQVDAGAMGILSWEKGEAVGQIGWTQDRCCGVKFTAALSEELLEASRLLQESQLRIERERRLKATLSHAAQRDAPDHRG